MDIHPPVGVSVGRYARIVFLTLLLAYCYVLPRWADWNQNSRFDLTRALVERHKVAIDDYVANTGDYATVNGQIVSDKAPGLSLLAVPPYALYHLALRIPAAHQMIDGVAHRGAFATTLNQEGTGLGGEKEEAAVALVFVTALCVAVPTAFLGVCLADLFRRFSPYEGANAVAAIALMLATPIAAYGDAFYGHVPAAVLLFTAFALLVRTDATLTAPRLLALGALLATALVMEYPTALVIAALGLWTLARLWRQRTLTRLGWVTLGGLPFLLLLALYDRAAYGTLLPTGYEHSTLWQDRHSEGFLSLTYPKADALWGATFGDFRGLFFLAPILLLAIPGYIIWWRTGRDRIAWCVTLWSVVAFLLFDASSSMWWGGFAVGPRYVLPILPFLYYPIGSLIPALVRHWRVTVGASLLMVLSLVHVWMQLLAGQGYPPDTVRHPLTDYVLPRIAAGDIARNVGMALGFRHLWSIAPLVFILLLMWGLNLLRWHLRARQITNRTTIEVRYVRP